VSLKETTALDDLMAVAKCYSYLAMLIVSASLFLALLGQWVILVPGHEGWILATGWSLFVLSTLATLALLSARVRKAAIDKRQRWRFYLSFMVIGLYLALSLSFFVFPINE
jgi:hypothetical protein